MTRKLARRPLFRTVLTSILVLSGCARSAIESEGEDDDAAYSIFEAGAEPEDDAEPPKEEDASEPPGMDAGSTPDAGGAQQDAAQEDTGVAGSPDGAAGSLDGAAGAPDAGAVDAATDVAPRDAAADAARDAAPVDAAPPPVDTAPPAPKCTAGNYRGMFMGSVIVEFLTIPLFEILLTGDISLSAAAEAGTDRFTISNGAIVGKDNEDNQVTATVTGSLNCTTGKVENGRLSGRYFRPFLGEILFDGNVAGTYTNTPPSANGTWQTETASTDLLKGGMGTWNVSLVP